VVVYRSVVIIVLLHNSFSELLINANITKLVSCQGREPESCSSRAPLFLTQALLATYCLHCNGSNSVLLLSCFKHTLSMITTVLDYKIQMHFEALLQITKIPLIEIYNSILFESYEALTIQAYACL
jgi:hypothetical protein